jgi:dipeptidyl aminopeptidase/acylaminoacyl peptidase
MKIKLLSCAAIALLLQASSSYSENFTVDHLNNLNKLHDISVSPNGISLLYGLKKGMAPSDDHLYLQTIKTGKVQQITSHQQGESNVLFAGDGNSIYFLSQRSGTSQIWQLPLTGGEARQVSDLVLPVNGFTLSADQQTFALTIDVNPNCPNLACTVAAQDELDKQKDNVRIYDQLAVRHWDHWKTQYKQHLFIAHLPQQADLPETITQVIDLMPSWQGDVGAIDQVSFHPNAKSLVFSAKLPAKDNAWSTNYDLFEVDLTKLLAEENESRAATSLTTPALLQNITAQNKAVDSNPVFSANGRFLAYLSMTVPGNEADKLSIKVRDNVTGQVKEIARQWDRSVDELVFGADNRTLFVTAHDLGQKSLFAINSEFGDVRKVYNVGYAQDITLAGDVIYFSRNSLNTPKDIFSINTDGYGIQQLTTVNKQKLANIDFAQYKQFSFKGWSDETVYGYWMKPANFEPGKQYPIAYLVHGGPQGSFGNKFHARWNAQLWAAQGYGVVMVDFHGSVGYGQKFTDAISTDWGGKPLEDLQKGLDFIVKDQPWLDGDRACAIGASYGGYMMNWFAGQWPDRFNCLINHAGLFDLPSFYGSTDELWFAEHEMKGPVWQGSKDYTKFNPAAFVNNWKTPMLVIHGERDYRVPYNQSLATFTALQRKGIDSRLVIFPDENHHIRQPENLKTWYREVFNWLNRYTAQPQISPAPAQPSVQPATESE